MIRFAGLVLGLGGLCSSCTTGPPPPEAPAPSGPDRTGVALTVYNGGRALVKDSRTFDLEPGHNNVRFDEVTSGITPGSVQVEGQDGSEVDVREQNFEYDLVSTPRLLRR